MLMNLKQRSSIKKYPMLFDGDKIKESARKRKSDRRMKKIRDVVNAGGYPKRKDNIKKKSLIARGYADKKPEKYKATKRKVSKDYREKHPNKVKKNEKKSMIKTLCQTSYKQKKRVEEDPEAMTPEFMAEMLGVDCKKLKDKKGDE